MPAVQTRTRVTAHRPTPEGAGADGSVRDNARGGQQSAVSRPLQSAGILGRSGRYAVTTRRGRRTSPPLWRQDVNGEWWINLDVLYRDMWICPADIDRQERGKGAKSTC